MKTLLIRPPYTRLKQMGQAPYFPLGLGYIAAVLRENGFETAIYHAENTRFPFEKLSIDSDQIFESRSISNQRYREVLRDDSHFVWKEVRETLESYKPDVIGISILSVEVGSALKISQIAKEINPNCKVVWGGEHPSFMPEGSLKNEAVDFVVVGEGEETMLELCQTLKNGSNQFNKINGLVYKENGAAVRNPARELIQDLDSLPLPARDLILYPESFDFKSMGSMIASRGCPWRCTFCSSREFWSKKLRFRSPENVMKEIKVLHDEYQTNFIMFWDDSFTVHKKVIKKFCQGIIDSGMKIGWRTATRADLIDEEMLAIMKKSGCVKLEIGVESGSDRMKKLIMKDVSNEQIKKAFKLIKEAGISSGAFFMAGFPQETKEDLMETFQLMKELKSAEIAFNVFDPMPGSVEYENCIKLGIVPEEPDWNDFPLWPDTHYMVEMSKEDFNREANKMAKWLFTYNNSFNTRFQRGRHLFTFLLVNDPILLAKKIFRVITSSLGLNALKPFT